MKVLNCLFPIIQSACKASSDSDRMASYHFWAVQKLTFGVPDAKNGIAKVNSVFPFWQTEAIAHKPAGG